jgi:hypothetical protein
MTEIMMESRFRFTNEYRKHATRALSSASSPARVREARAALAAYKTDIADEMPAVSTQLEEMDRNILLLIERANTFRSIECREAANEVARHARESYSSLERTRGLWQLFFDQMQSVLRAIVDNGGDLNIVAWVSSEKALAGYNKDLEEAKLATKVARQKCRDAFAAFQGKAKLYCSL